MANKAENFVDRMVEKCYYTGMDRLDLALALTNMVCDKLKCTKIPPEYVSAICVVCNKKFGG